MNLDERNLHREQRIAQRYAGLGVAGGIDDDEGDALVRGGVDALDQGMLGIALKSNQLMAHNGGGCFQYAIDAIERSKTVMAGGAAARRGGGGAGRGRRGRRGGPGGAL